MNIQAKKSLGQNFLTDHLVIEKLLNNFCIKENDLIVEIGPGMGDLTRYLIKFNSYLIAYEIDKRMSKYLNHFNTKKTNIIFQDFLISDIKRDINNIKYENIYLVANIPYYITTPIIKKIIKTNIEFKKIVLLVQNEMADKLTSKVKDSNYNSLTILLQYYFNINKLFIVKNSSFTPSPKIDSAFIELVPTARKNKVINISIFEKLLKDSFQQKRKKLKNNLINYDLKKIEVVLNAYSLTIDNRPQEVPLDCYIDIANKL